MPEYYRLSATIHPDLVKQMDNIWEGHYRSRSIFVEEAIKLLIEKLKKQDKKEI